MQPFQAPTILDKAGGEPIEQLGMGRWSTLRSEIIRSTHEALAKVVLPDAVDDDTRGQRMIGHGEPLRKGKAPAGMVPFGLRLGRVPGLLRIVENSGNSRC